MPDLHPKTLRRVIILLAGAALLVSIAVGVYAFRQHQIESDLRDIRGDGLAAVERGDYQAALSSLKRYVSRHRSDAQALYAYGLARARVEEPNDLRHIKEPIEIFRTVLDIEPQNIAARRMLLEMYSKAGYNAEAIELANKLLERDASDAASLRAKAVALQRLRRWEEAAAVYERLNEVAPTDLASQLVTYGVYRKLRKPPEEILARARSMQEAHPEDPRFKLLLAIALGETGEMEQAMSMLRDISATAIPPDADFVRVLSSILERNRMFDESHALLERVSSDTTDPAILRVYAQRLWQDGDHARIAERLGSIDPADPTSDSELLAFRALALFELGRRDRATPVLEALARRTQDSRAIAWSAALETRFAEPPLDGRTAIDRYQGAIVRDSGNPIIRYYIGETYERLGETEPAINAWERAAELAPSWSRPHGKIARAFASTGRTREAVQHARQALIAAPQELYASVTYAVVMYLAQGPEAADGPDLLRRIEDIQRRSPHEPETLPIYVALLSRGGQRQRAIEVIQSMLDATAPATAPATTSPSTAPRPAPPLNQSVMLRLVAISRSEKLDMEQALLERLELTHASKPTPGLALARAGVLASQGRPMDGLAMLQSAARQAAEESAQSDTSSAALPWKLALAEYREYIHDPAAAADWVALGEAYPNDLQVQSAILKLATTVRSDREFIDRTIDRVRALTGAEGTLWRMERARWLLGSNRQKDLSEAVTMLNDIVRDSPTLTEPRLLLASGLEKVDNIGRAIRELQAAVDQQPNRPAVVLELVRLEQGLGRFDDALRRLERLSAEPENLSPETQRRIAALLAQQGETERALSLLETIYVTPSTGPAAGESLGSRDSAGQLLLAQLYRRRGRFAPAQAVYDQLLARTNPEPEVIHAAADFYASRGNFTTAQAALARLAQIQLRPGMRELILADFNDHYGPDKDAARQYYVAATEVAPGDPATWRELASFLLRNGQRTAALSAVDRGLSQLPNDARLEAMREQILAIEGATIASRETGDTASDLNPLIEALSREPGNAQTLAILQLIQAWREGELRPEEVTAGLRKLAADYPRNKAIHAELVRRYRAKGRLDDAADAALRAMELLPDDPAAAELAVDVLRQARRWKPMEEAARTWRERTLENPIPADIAIAEALLSQNAAPEALAHLQPSVNLSQPERCEALLPLYARCLIAVGAPEQARQILEPLIVEPGDWRRVWLELASRDLLDSAVAQEWIAQVAKLITPEASADERAMLAAAWQAIASRFDLEEARTEARAILNPLAAQADAPPVTWSILATLDEAAGDHPTAERNYRRALAANPGDPSLLNNLAYFLLSHDEASEAGNRRAESLELAQEAVRLAPGEPSFHDTLARAYLETGDREAALRHFQRALDLDPELLEALIGKARTLHDLGHTALAASVLGQIEAVLQRSSTQPATRPSYLAAPMARELEAVRRAIEGSEALDP